MCRHGIVADSSFSWWAGWLGEQERVLRGDRALRLHVNKIVMSADFWPGLLAGVTFMLYFIAAHGKGIIQGFAIILTAMFVFCLYRFLEGAIGRLFENIRPIRTAVLVIAGLSLEVYLSQGYITDRFNFLFPLNLPIVFLMVLFMAYLTRIIARTFTMTMQNTRSHRYDWRKVFSIV